MRRGKAGLVSVFLGLVLLLVDSLVTAQNVVDPVVIELGKQAVTRSEFDSLFNVAVRLLAAQQGIAFSKTGPEQLALLRKQFFGQRANEMALIQEAEHRNIAVSDEDVKSQFEELLGKIRSDAGNNVDEQILKRLLREKQQVSLLSAQLLKEIEVRPGEVVVMHHDVQDSLATPEQNCMRHIVVADLDNAKRLLAELKGGADFAELARQNSTDSTSVKNGGDVGCFEREHLVPLSEFERAVYNSNVNELTGPVSDGTAYHLLIIYKRKIASAPDLNEVYDQLENEIRHERLPDKLIQIRDASGVATYPERLDG